MPKSMCFLKKSSIIAQRQGLGPQTPFISGSWMPQTPAYDIPLSSAFNMRMCFILHDNKGYN